MATTPASKPDFRPPRFPRRVRGWLAGLRHNGRPRLFLAGALLFVSCAGAAVVAGMVEQQRRALTGRDYGTPTARAAEAAVIGLALEAGQVPPGLAAGEQVVVLDTGSVGGQPLVGMARVTALLGGTAAVRIGLEVPASVVGKVAAAEAQDRLALARLPMA